jgi:glycosyltransferase involved in cell wall biosynthesis
MGKMKKLAVAAKKGIQDPKKITKAFHVLVHDGPQQLRAKVSMNVSGEADYVWVRKVKLKKYSGPIKFSVVMPVYNVEIQWLEKAIASVEQQNYKNWEICIADDCSTKQEVRDYLTKRKSSSIKVVLLEQNQGISGATNEAAKLATGDYIVLMDNDDMLAVNALDEFFQRIKEETPDILYSDMDIIDEQDRPRDPLLKPDWSPDLLLSQMYVGHLLGFRKSLFEEVGGFRSEFNGSQDYDLMLRMTEKTDRIAHVPAILYHWRALPSSTATNAESKPYAQTAGLRAIQEHLDRVYGEGNAAANETEDLFVYDVRYRMQQEPLVSVIIPTKDHVELLKPCIESILEKTEYRNYEIIIINNNSEQEETFAYLSEIEKNEKVSVKDAPIDFNWSKLNNIGMEAAHGDVFICMNNDMKVIAPEWMERLAEKAMRPEVGVVGGLLLYEDGTIQHAGVVIGMGGWADHVFKGMEPKHYGSPYISPMVTRNVSAVTGACLAVSRSTIAQIGNFDENFIICGSDIELALRAKDHGLFNIYDPHVKLYHYESKSRDSYIPKIDFELSDKIYKSYRKTGDPFYNNNLDYYCCQPKARAAIAVTVEEEADKMSKRKEREMGLSALDVEVHEIVPYTFRECDYKARRLNLLVPSINTCHVFGGISTALKFYDRMLETTGYDARIILVDAIPDKEAVEKYEKLGYSFVKPEEESSEKKQVISYSDRFNRSIPVSENDYFMLTGWWTAYCAQDAYVGFTSTFGIKPNPFLYFIQDYEPGFYPWSTRYLLADSTYRSEYPTIAVFNSMLLKEYFDQNDYQFYHSFAFDPVLNDGLRGALEKLPQKIQKKKQIVVYGRPGTERNAFNLLVAALRKWVYLQPDIEEWEVLSAGELHKAVALGNGKELVSVGKLSIEEYAKLLEESYAGISLMCSPHPSYPPLEMSVFSVKTITNTYGNKDLSSFNDNMVSLSNTSPLNIANHLLEICKGYTPEVAKITGNESYISNDHVFDFVEEIKSIWEN